MPVVGIFSDPKGEKFHDTKNVYGANAQRIQLAHACFDHFVDEGKVQHVYVLHRTKNTASEKAVDDIRANAKHKDRLIEPLLSYPKPTKTLADLVKSVPAGGGAGLFVTPVDLFFGNADLIHQAAHVPVCWSAPDYVPPGLLAYGAGQYDCGRTMGKQVQYIIEHQMKIPTDTTNPKRFETVDPKLVISAAAAKALKVEIKKNPKAHVI
jgi:ABC-type uncharacterized transport system substrate-binding protein